MQFAESGGNWVAPPPPSGGYLAGITNAAGWLSMVPGPVGTIAGLVNGVGAALATVGLGALAKLGTRAARSTETIVRRMSAVEAEATVAARGLVPKAGSSAAKWVSAGAAQRSLPKAGHEVTVSMQVEAGTTDWLRSLSVDFSKVKGEAALPGGVLTKGNEPGAFGIGKDVLQQFNGKVMSANVQ